MCGIVGIWKKDEFVDEHQRMDRALQLLKHRGPDSQNYTVSGQFMLGHARLSIIDPIAASNQPFVSADGNYQLVFNGEIYNFKSLRKKLVDKGVAFNTASDTEVLLYHLIANGIEGIKELDGFFAFAFLDIKSEKMILARDRMGIKPLLIYQNETTFIFASELTAFKAFDIDFNLDQEALNMFIGLTYIPAPLTILKSVVKVLPGECVCLNANGEVTKELYYKPNRSSFKEGYEVAKKELYQRLELSVKNRMISDVSLGCFLSGGVDSSVIAALAKIQHPNLKTFSIGFDHPYFNESNYADEVAQHIGSQHEVYTLTKKDFKTHFTSFLAAIDEPFADSSAFAVYLLSKKTKEHVTVALSGDGADELFGGYRKHKAEWEIQNMSSIKSLGLNTLGSLLKNIKENRSDRWGDLNRKLQKLTRGMKKSPVDRYWEWCQFVTTEKRSEILNSNSYKALNNPIEYQSSDLIGEMLLADQKLVLPNDMLKKVDVMSMANSLEVRTPFLDHKVVEFANSLPAHFKLTTKGGKQILKDTFAHLLPVSVLNRPKKGFEIPIKEWLEKEIEALLGGKLFSKRMIEEQQLFDYEAIQVLKRDWGNSSFGDRIYLVWELIIFQHWWVRFFMTEDELKQHD